MKILFLRNKRTVIILAKKDYINSKNNKGIEKVEMFFKINEEDTKEEFICSISIEFLMKIKKYGRDGRRVRVRK